MAIDSVDERGMQGARRSDKRFDHWPYAAQYCRATLDFERLESHAVRILARGMQTQRLVAFVGAGASIAYGRMSWPGLMTALFNVLEKLAETDPVFRQQWKTTVKRLWPSGLKSFLDYSDQTLKAQILSDMLNLKQRLGPRGSGSAPSKATPAEALQRVTKHLLEDFHGFVELLCAGLDGRISKDDAQALAMAAEGLDERLHRRTKLASDLKEEIAELRPERRGLVGVLDALFDHSLSTPDALANALIACLSQHSIEIDSPIRQLALDWSIRRFITTNYDREIERSLTALNYVPRQPGASDVRANQFETLNFSAAETGQALRFALEGPRRHTSVLHLHGDVVDAASLIVTETHYQQLYLDKHPRRDLVARSTQANFAANAILFVGSDVSEDDVLRPMREFMSSSDHRLDRMAVALFIAIKPAHEREQRRAQLLLKYGVHTIYVGFSCDRERRAAERRPTWIKPWLFRLHEQHERFKTLLRTIDIKSNGPLGDAGATALREIAEGLKRLALIRFVEGILTTEGHRFYFAKRLQDLAKELCRGAESPGSSAGLPRLSAQFENTFNWIGNCFVCAKLMVLKEQAIRLMENDTCLAKRCSAPISTLEDILHSKPKRNSAGIARLPIFPKIHVRHGVKLDHIELKGRFERIASRPDPGLEPSTQATEIFDEHLSELFAAIRADAPFRDWHGRRMLLVCAARGFGKGGQFDRLAAQTSGGTRGHLLGLMDALSGYHLGTSDEDSRVIVYHCNMSFSNELGSVISQVTRLIWAAAGKGVPSYCDDQLELLGQGLQALTDANNLFRVLIILGNAGVLYDADGLPKNGQIRRVMRQLLSPRFLDARMDILMYVGESQMPAAVRHLVEKTEIKQGDAPVVSGPSALMRLPDKRGRRRLNRLNIKNYTPVQEHTLVFPLPQTRTTDLALAYFPELARALGWSATESREDRARRLHFATGGSRFAQTLLLALLDAAEGEDSGGAGPAKLLEEVLAALTGPPSGSAIETAIEFVLDRWGQWHLLRKPVRLASLPPLHEERPDPVLESPLLETMKALTARLMPEGWLLASELMWHLGAFSHPVERCILLACPRVQTAVEGLRRSLRSELDADFGPMPQPEHFDDLLVEATLELLAHWCLVFRVKQRPRLKAWEDGDREAPRRDTALYRYAPHRHMQRHLLRMMGGRNVEPTQWDQFTTTIYASLPDESPILKAEAHQALTEVVRTLTRYPDALPSHVDKTPRQMVLEGDCIRAAYYLVRSTYSPSVISHLAPNEAVDAKRVGHMEDYRRLVRWITHAAVHWQEDYAHLQAEGLFYPGELIWLYNECGVVSLSQGKLLDAEHALTLAERAARLVEADDTGSLHTRIRIHTALVQLERGRPHRAKQILTPIAERRNGHPVPPLLADLYLGQIEHIGGNYRTAEQHYDSALVELRKLNRSRAVAFGLLSKADIVYKLHSEQFPMALSIADEAISLAQQGGHEDLRVLATLDRTRLCIEAGRIEGQHLFEQLSFAQQYAARMDMPRIACDVHELRARLLLKQGEFHMSAADAVTSLEIAAKYELKLKKARGLLTLARIYKQRGELSGARSLAAMGREIAASCDYYACVRGFKELELSFGQPPLWSEY